MSEKEAAAELGGEEEEAAAELGGEEEAAAAELGGLEAAAAELGGEEAAAAAELGRELAAGAKRWLRERSVMLLNSEPIQRSRPLNWGGRKLHSRGWTSELASEFHGPIPSATKQRN